jgi:hypothetical protein
LDVSKSFWYSSLKKKKSFLNEQRMRHLTPPPFCERFRACDISM